MRADKIKRPSRPAIIELSEDQWREIERSLGIKCQNLAFRRRVSRHIEVAFLPDGPPPLNTVGGARLLKVKGHLETLRKEAARLEKTLARLKATEETDRSSNLALYETVRYWMAAMDHEFPDLWKGMTPVASFLDSPDDLRTEQRKQFLLDHPILQADKFVIASVSHLAKASAAALKSLPKSKGGKPKNPNFEKLVANLAVVYRQETGKKAVAGTNATGTFFKFCHACLKAFAPKLATGEKLTLAKQMQRVLGLDHVRSVL